MLFFQWSGSAGYWLLHSPHPRMVGPFLMNIGGCNNFILSTDAERLLIQLSSGCQWRLIASGCGKLIPEEMSFICFSNSGKNIDERILSDGWRTKDGWNICWLSCTSSGGWERMHGASRSERSAQDPPFSMQSSPANSWVRSSLVDRSSISSTKTFEGNNKKATKVTKENKEKRFSFIVWFRGSASYTSKSFGSLHFYHDELIS